MEVLKLVFVVFVSCTHKLPTKMFLLCFLQLQLPRSSHFQQFPLALRWCIHFIIKQYLQNLWWTCIFYIRFNFKVKQGLDLLIYQDSFAKKEARTESQPLHYIRILSSQTCSKRQPLAPLHEECSEGLPTILYFFVKWGVPKFLLSHSLNTFSFR